MLYIIVVVAKDLAQTPKLMARRFHIINYQNFMKLSSFQQIEARNINQVIFQFKNNKR
jgi:hypothetical protein